MSGESRGSVPAGWAEACLGGIVESRSGKADPQATPDAKFIGMEQVEAHTMRLLGTVPASSLKSGANVFAPGDVLYGRLRSYLNKVYQPDFGGLCSGEFIVLAESIAVLGRFLKYRLNAGDFVRFANGINTGDRPRVDFDHLKGFRVALPPKPEQERIADALDELFSDLDAGVASLEQVREKLKLYRASVLKGAVEGTLTGEWRAEHAHTEPATELLERILVERRRRWEEDQLAKFEAKGREPPKSWKAKYKEPVAPTADLLPLPEGWCWATWPQVGLSQNGRSFPSEDYRDSGTKLIRPGNLYDDGVVRWTERNTRYMPNHYADEASDLIVRGGELVMNLTAQSLKDDFLGRVCLTPVGERCLLNQRLARLSPVIVDPRFMLLVFKAASFRKFVARLNTGSLIQHMFTSQLDEFVFPLPPSDEQAVIVEAVEDQLSVIDHLDGDLAVKLKSADSLRQSILRHAFSGQLVPQDPNDEPASELLKRIAADRETRSGSEAGSPRPRGRGRRSNERRA